MSAPEAETGGPVDRSAAPLDTAFELACEPGAVEQGRLRLLAFLEPWQLSPRVINRLEVVLEELVTNIVKAAALSGGASGIGVSASLTPSHLELEVSDDGLPFDPLLEPEPDAFTTLADARIGGLGIPLIRRLTTSAAYARKEAGEPGGRARNHLKVTFAR